MSLGVLIDSVGGLGGKNVVYVFGEELDGKLVTDDPNEKQNSRPGELVDSTYTVHTRPICGRRNS